MQKKVLMVIAFDKFRDEEYQEPKAVLENAGIQVTTASSQLGVASGKLGAQTKIDITLEQVRTSDYDAILFIGGPGIFNHYDDPICHKIAKEAVSSGKILGAICAAPGVLARAGVLKGKKATMFEDTGEIKKGGGIYTRNGVEIDGIIITATGPETARAWGEAIANKLK